jgi:hypothetical protein
MRGGEDAVKALDRAYGGRRHKRDERERGMSTAALSRTRSSLDPRAA